MVRKWQQQDKVGAALDEYERISKNAPVTEHPKREYYVVRVNAEYPEENTATQLTAREMAILFPITQGIWDTSEFVSLSYVIGTVSNRIEALY